VSVKFFGQFLLERGLVTRDHLLQAIRLQESRDLRLGDYAIRRGYLTELHAERINQAQLTTDKRFGEIAMEMGLLTAEQLDELLTLQQNDYMLLGEALLNLGAIQDGVLERELEAFKKDQARYIVDDVVFPPGSADASLLAIPIDLTAKLMLRLLGIHGKIGEGEREVRYPVERLVSVSLRFSGSLEFDYTLSVSKDIALCIAERILGEPPGPGEEDVVIDSVKELCNVVCGNAAAKYAQIGRRVEIGPPSQGAPKLGDGKKFIMFPLHVAEGAVEVRILR
jgi:CheY-specific phosphatase CheX